MSDDKPKQDTVIVERHFAAAPAKVFAAFADVEQLAQWYSPTPTFATVVERDFRVGGRMVSTMSPRPGVTITREATFLEIVPERRIVSGYSARDGEGRFSVTLETVDIIPEGSGTHLVFIDQTVCFRMVTPEMRRGGLEAMGERLDRWMKR